MRSVKRQSCRPYFVRAAAVAGLILGAGCSEQAADPVAQPAKEAAPTEAVAAVSHEIPVTTSSESARKLHQEGLYLLDVGRGVKARNKFLAAVAEDPGFVRARLDHSNAALSFQDFQEALDGAAEHLDGASEAERLMVEINRTFLTNDNESGVKLAQKLVDQFPKSARARLVLAGMQITVNDHVSARQSNEAALKLDPDSAGALTGLAGSYLFGEPKDFTKAEHWARKFIAAYPEEAKGYETLGDIMRAQNKLEEALAAYNKASETDPTLEVASHKRGHVNSFLGNIEDARAAYDDAVAAAPAESKAGYAVYKAFTHIHGGDIAAALDELDELSGKVEAMGTPAHQVKGLQVFALNSAATAALHAGMMDQAADIIARRNELIMAIAEDVGTDDARRLQTANCHMWDGLLAAYGGNADAAAEYAAKIGELVADDDNPRKMEPAHFVLGMSALKAGDAAGAVEHLRQADHANNMYIRYQLAVAEEANGNAEEAKRLFATVASFNFNSVGFALTRKDAMSKAASA